MMRMLFGMWWRIALIATFEQAITAVAAIDTVARAFEQYVDLLRQFAPLAEEQGVMIVVEPLNRGECNLINTVREGAEAVRRANHPAVKLLVDLFHMLRNGESPDDLLAVGPPR